MQTNENHCECADELTPEDERMLDCAWGFGEEDPGALSNDNHIPSGSPNGGQFAPATSKLQQERARIKAEREARLKLATTPEQLARSASNPEHEKTLLGVMKPGVLHTPSELILSTGLTKSDIEKAAFSLSWQGKVAYHSVDDAKIHGQEYRDKLFSFPSTWDKSSGEDAPLGYHEGRVYSSGVGLR